MSDEATPETIYKWTYKDMPCLVKYIPHTVGYITASLLIAGAKAESVSDIEVAEGHYCGYVHVPFCLTQEQITSVDVHGGITYQNHEPESAIYGFDTDHNNSGIWTLEQTIAETERLADNLLQIHTESEDT